MSDKITNAMETLTELTGIETADELENAIFATSGGLYEVGVENIEAAEWAGVDLLSGASIISEPMITLEGTPLSPTIAGEKKGKTHSLSDFVEEIDSGWYEFVRVEE